MFFALLGNLKKWTYPLLSTVQIGPTMNYILGYVVILFLSTYCLLKISAVSEIGARGNVLDTS